ncbi:MAG TPA: hypothetical protein VMV65_04010 [Alphaproteobacteria bacterium]|nr:hypothetical protein [Alphaproteobacteria bacterium]
MRRFLCFMLSAFFVLSTGALGASSSSATGPAHVDSAYLTSLSWRLIGPLRGGRALAVTGVPGEPDHYYFGAVDGGVWESTNAGRTWNPIFDSENVASIGAIAVAPSDVKTLYVGSGEADMRSDIAYGNGMYKSTDGGKSWTHIGLDDTRQIGSIAIDPHDANVVYVAALGHAYGPNAQRGVFKTTDGGKTWSKVLYKDENTGAISLSIDPQHPDTVYAALWQTRRPPWNTYPPSNGPGSGLYKTTDGGKTWAQLTSGLPAKVGRIGVAVAPSDPSRVYAQVDSPANVAQGGVYRSDDGGATWTHEAGGKSQQRIWERGWYFGRITIDPKNPDVVYVMDTATYRSDDGGKTFNAIKGSPGGDDYHTLWINPDDPTHMILGSDQGVVVSLDRAKTWSSWYNQPTAQLYHVVADNRFPYWVYGAQQDSGAMAVPSQSIHQNITFMDWRPIDVGGESGYIAVDPSHPGKLFGGNDATYEALATGWEQSVDAVTAYPDHVWRQTWTLPLIVSPVDRALYTSRQQIFRSRDDGKSWTIISPDLTGSAAEDHPANLDPATLADSSGLPRRGVVYALAPSPFDAGTLWAGTDDGRVWITRDGGTHWDNITPPQLTPWSKVGIIDASRLDRNTAYIAVDRHRLEDYRPYIYKTTDGGRHWTAIVNGIPDGSFVNVVRADTKVRGLLYAGTERGVYVSFDDGAHWQSLQRNLPVTSVRDIDVHDGDLVIGTHGRSMWIMDDIEPLREMARAVGSGGNYLFTPATTIRFNRAGGVGGGIADEGTPIQPDDPQAPNPPLGMYVDYYLHGAASTPVTIEFLGPHGGVFRRYSSADKPNIIDPSTQQIAPRWIPAPVTVDTDPGAHRFVWDFSTHHDGGPLAPPGTYTVRLTVDGKTFTRSAAIVRDPRLSAGDHALLEQFALATSIDGKLAQIDSARTHAQALLKSGKLSAARAAQLRAILGVRGTADPDDSVGKPAQDFSTLRFLYMAFSGLFGAVEMADAAPTHDQGVAYAKLAHTLEGTIARLAAIAGPK